MSSIWSWNGIPLPRMHCQSHPSRPAAVAPWPCIFSVVWWQCLRFVWCVCWYHHGMVECDIVGQCPPFCICVCGNPKSDKIGNPGCKDNRQQEARPGFLAYLCLDCRPYDMGCFGSAASKQDADESKKQKEKNKKINQQIQKDKQVYRATHRLLLLGRSNFILFHSLVWPCIASVIMLTMSFLCCSCSQDDWVKL